MNEDIREERRTAARDRRELHKLLSHGHGHDAWGYVLFVAWVGALFYYVHLVSGFWPVILAILKSVVWPALLLYHVLGALGLS